MAPCKSGILLLAAAAPASALKAGRADDACKCLNWNEAYTTHGAQCGAGFEKSWVDNFLKDSAHFQKESTHAYLRTGRDRLSQAEKIASNASALMEMHRSMLNVYVCNDTLPKIDDNFCVNVETTNDHESWANGQWCYVDAACKDAIRKTDGEKPLGVKLCGADDSWLRSMNPVLLQEMSQEKDFNVAVLAKFAYPVVRSVPWRVARTAWGASNAEATLTTIRATFKHSVELQTLKMANTPMIIDSDDGFPPFGVVLGETAWTITVQPREDQVTGRPSSVTEMKCVSGCSWVATDEPKEKPV